MLAARSSAARSASRIARNFATVSEASGFKVASVDSNSPTSAVTLLVKAGSRFEPKAGVAHALKNFAFKSTTKRSALGTVRESELYGGVLSATLSREHLALTAEFLRGDESFFVDLLTSFITSGKFTRHEFEEYVVPVMQSESIAAFEDPATFAVELAHALAFRSGLGASLFASAHSPVTQNDVKAYAQAAFAKGNVAFLGTGIEQASLSQLIEKGLGSATPSGSALSSSASKYFGGETRHAAHTGLETVFLGFGSAGSPSAEIATLSAYLSTQPSVKWSKGVSSIAAELPEGASVKSVYLPYSDATLFGLLVQAKTTADVTKAGQAAVKALKDAGSSISEEQIKSAVAKAKFSAATALDTRDGFTTGLGSKVLSGSDASVESTLSAFDKVNASGFTKAVSALTKAKPTYVAIGDTTSLPHIDELGL